MSTAAHVASRLLLLALVTSLASAAAVNFAMSSATLLSGGLTDCPTPTGSRCVGGVATVSAYHRNYTAATGEPVLFLPEADRESPFAQMHTLQWGVNGLILRDRFGFRTFRSTHALLTSSRDLTALEDNNMPLLLTNVLIPPSNSWVRFTHTVFFDAVTRIALMSIQSSAQPNSFDTYESLNGALALVAKANTATSNKWIPVVLFGDRNIGWTEFIQFATSHPHKPAVIIEFEGEQTDNYTTPVRINGTWVASCEGVEEDAAPRYRFELTNAGTANTVSAVTLTVNDLAALPASMKDAQYVADQVYLKSLADAAATNDPVVGQSMAMPVTRTGNFRSCMAGECILGNLFTDAMRWKMNTDVAFTPSGGLRGTGWPAGPVKVSNLWSALPFANQVCRGTISGLSMFKILNFSTATATFTSTRTEMGDRLLQLSGVRATYNTQLEVSPNVTGSGRLVRVDVLNRATGAYEPLERLRMYTFAADSFLCADFDPYPDFLTDALVEGEVAGTITDELLQNAVGEFLTAVHSTTPYNTTVSGRLVNDTTATAFMSWVHTRQTCPKDTEWDEEVLTCTPCAEGSYQPDAGTLHRCQPKPVSTAVIIVVIVVPLLLIALVGVLVFRTLRDPNVRDVANAPKSGMVTLMFTDIQDSTKLWSTVPMCMSIALEKHHQVIRQLIEKRKAYEVKTAGDSFMIACGDVTDGVGLAMDIQREMLKATFPAAIDLVYAAENDDELEAIDDDPSVMSDPAAAAASGWNGLRVRIGVHCGEAQIVFDEVSKGYDYYGSPVNVAARTESVAHGGQVAITESTLHLIDPKSVGIAANASSLGAFNLKGVTGPTPIHELVPSELSAVRIFKPGKLQLEGSHEVTEDDDATSLASGGHESDVSNAVSDYRNFMKAMFKAVKPKEQETIMRIFENSWKVRRCKKFDDTLLALARRVSHVQERAEKRADRLMKAGLGESINANSMARLSMNIPKTPSMGAMSPKAAASVRKLPESADQAGEGLGVAKRGSSRKYESRASVAPGATTPAATPDTDVKLTLPHSVDAPAGDPEGV